LQEMTAATMMNFLYELPQQFAHSLELDFSRLGSYRRAYRQVVVSGLGGSAIGGDILRVYARSRARIPIFVNREYEIPAFVNEDTLFVAVSYSGNTEETISAYQWARKQGAAIFCITTGGKLAEMADSDGNAVIEIPGGLVPRAATGFLFAPLALAMEELGVLPALRTEIKETAAVLEALREELHPGVEGEQNLARKIAASLKGALPIIWGTGGFSEVAALRWKAQINENAKSPAYYNIFPELNHNEIVGFEAPASIISQSAVIILRDHLDHPRVQKRMDITRSIIEGRVKEIIEVKSRGDSALARLYSLIYVGDYASTYLALEYDINPTPVKVIDYLKDELARE